MKKANKKGFTIVELVIVIAVIAILAAVLIPTFANVTNKANESAAMQKARIAYENYLAENADKEDLSKLNVCIKVDKYYFYVTGGQFSAEAHDSCATGTEYDKHYVVTNNETFDTTKADGKTSFTNHKN